MISFLSVGGGNEIGANCFYLNINGNGIILDCGIHPQKVGIESLPKFELLENKTLDHALISHAHQDHIAALPFLIKKFPYIKIFTTPQTRALAELTLHNAVSILKKEIKDEQFEFYTHDEVDLLIKMINYYDYEKDFLLSSYHQLKEADVIATFFDAGHILGSSGIFLNNNGYKIFYTGDINLANQTIQPAAILPNTKINTLILESTYGATDSREILDWQKEAERFAKEANKILTGGSSILVPVFALGKLQEMLATIWSLMQKRKLSQVDVFTGGIGTKINRVYDYNRYVINRIDKEFELSSIPQNDYSQLTSVDDFFRNPSIVLASSGMIIKGTSSYDFAMRFLQQKNSAIFTVGYMDERTPGYPISKAKKGDKIFIDNSDKPLEVKCEIKNFRFSAHARREQLISIVKKLKPDNVILVHGDEEAFNWMGKEILKNFPGIKVHAAVCGKEIVLENQIILNK
ncbi:Putative RNA-processing exonuclease [Ignavibacterium album JCM 16511]|uniref:Putative RNA-processing exonuclease n=1 Tax=Ignavibacterium album (strain DSM 19864 / JCM 16511 / NBRC 101810 / Mat9-16) TaxID=945713 RepID=I0AN17_IGNAJ|nr:MBL fold metallo-hydrolase [Ignavibacterium album]AFH50374.1 Putative RNA-processing exonuclease [Ignavibacterium album JCM 16511]